MYLCCVELQKMTQKQHIATLANNSQNRLVWYKQQLGDVYRLRNTLNYPEWYKELLRDLKNFEEGWLKSLQVELTNINQGL